MLQENFVLSPGFVYNGLMADLTEFWRRRLGLYPALKQPKLIMNILVKNEIDILERQLIFHKAQGVDGFIVTDNLSTDGTRELLQKYQTKGWIREIIDEPAQDYSQAEWTHRMILLARDKYQADWIINADADEFWSAKNGNLKAELATIRHNKVFVPVYNMLDQGADDWLDNTEKITAGFPARVKARLIASGKLSRHSQFIVCWKVIHRSADYLSIHVGNHNADMAVETRRRTVKNIQIYHYNLRGLKQFRRKVLTGGAAFARNSRLNKNAGKHWRYFYEGLQSNTLNLETEYAKTIGACCRAEIQKYKLLRPDDTVKKFFENR